MKDVNKINPINAKDRESLSDLSSTFDLGTQTIIDMDDEDLEFTLSKLMSDTVDNE
tara:strand:+ start:9793 stop:9960 length:168 start_codon:yes stop_codon:yes gene_type:complete